MTPPVNTKSPASIQLKDPVCGMDVTADSKHHHQHGDEDYYFCSDSCLTKFKAAPDTYLGKEKLKDPVCGMDVTSRSEEHTSELQSH